MPDLSDPDVGLPVAGLVLLNAVVYGALLALFRPGPEGYFARNGAAAGWAVCLAVSVLLNAIALFELPLIVSFAAWWAAALLVFRLTVRQAIKFSIAQGVIYVLLVFAVVAALK